MDKSIEPGVTSEHITAITLDESSLTARTPEIEHERQVAMNDLVQWNHFAVKDLQGPYSLALKTADNRISFGVTTPHSQNPLAITVPLAPFRGLIRDYFLICESYSQAVKTGNLARIEAIDMSRRGLHNEGAELLMELLADKIDMDSQTFAPPIHPAACAAHQIARCAYAECGLDKACVCH